MSQNNLDNICKVFACAGAIVCGLAPVVAGIILKNSDFLAVSAAMGAVGGAWLGYSGGMARYNSTLVAPFYLPPEVYDHGPVDNQYLLGRALIGSGIGGAVGAAGGVMAFVGALIGAEIGGVVSRYAYKHPAP